jgi:hypothetical protein
VKNEIVVYSETAEVGMMFVVTSRLHALNMIPPSRIVVCQ